MRKSLFCRNLPLTKAVNKMKCLTFRRHVNSGTKFHGNLLGVSDMMILDGE